MSENMRIFDVEVRQVIRVELDASKFDEAFMEEFRDGFYPFDTLSAHAEHIGQLYARGIVDLSDSREFIEGYGPANEMGIKAEQIDQTTIDQTTDVWEASQ